MSVNGREQKPYRILLIEDSVSDAAFIKLTLREDPLALPFVLEQRAMLKDGLVAACSGAYDLILLDLNLPDSNGLETFVRVKLHDVNIPVVVLTSLGGEELALEAVAQGAQDFLFKDRLDPYWVAHSIRHAISRHQLLQRVKQAEAREVAAAHRANQAKSEFLAAMSHEIRTPIGSVLMAAHILLDDTCDASEIKEMGSIISRNAEHLLALVNDILDLSKVEAGCLSVEKKPLHLPSFLEEVSAAFKPLARNEGIDLQFSCPDFQLPIIHTDSLRLRQILNNLLGNALKFSAGGNVKVNVAAAGEHHAGLAIEVKDSGIGMNAEQQQQLFKPFSQADASIQRKYGGTGLGLSLSRRLAEALDGKLELSWSEPGVGSAFTLHLPLCVPRKDASSGFVLVG